MREKCPYCGSSEQEFVYSQQYGHGDSTWADGRIKCRCGLSVGDFGGWGGPEDLDKVRAWDLWNLICKVLNEKLK